ncbi:MAG: hypothetical protein WC455_19010 [Dehalococcoidia bacterium]
MARKRCGLETAGDTFPGPRAAVCADDRTGGIWGSGVVGTRGHIQREGKGNYALLLAV